MEKLELRDEGLFLVNEKQVDIKDADAEIKAIELQIEEMKKRVETLNKYKARKEITNA